jgi:hypothetical protein
VKFETEKLHESFCVALFLLGPLAGLLLIYVFSKSTYIPHYKDDQGYFIALEFFLQKSLQDVLENAARTLFYLKTPG